MSRTRVKICGITTSADAQTAVEAGADAIGLVFAESKRQVTLARAHEIAATVAAMVSIVGVWMDQPLEEIIAATRETRLHAIQLHGRESPNFWVALRQETGLPIIKRLAVGDWDTKGVLGPRISKNVRGALPLLDPGAGDGRTFDWRLAAGLRCRFVLSGGLTPQNVGEAIRIARPFAVDVSSSVESKPGRKDARKMRMFIEAVRQADLELNARANRVGKDDDVDNRA
ncbi:MAG: phosphoribosylanthranilate isomerase [Planctomycetes bacterium]|nr:phosphoribosylanthranilate isomerase [Planctomycetota bacterium]